MIAGPGAAVDAKDETDQTEKADAFEYVRRKLVESEVISAEEQRQRFETLRQ